MTSRVIAGRLHQRPVFVFSFCILKTKNPRHAMRSRGDIRRRRSFLDDARPDAETDVDSDDAHQHQLTSVAVFDLLMVLPGLEGKTFLHLRIPEPSNDVLGDSPHTHADLGGCGWNSVGFHVQTILYH